MNSPGAARWTRQLELTRTALAVALALAAGRLPAQSNPDTLSLDRMVVTATRTPVPAGEGGSSVDYLSGSELAAEQIGSVRDALAGLAGAPLVTSGAPGAVTSLFLRGANSNQTLFLVDGIRLNDPDTDYSVWLGGAAVSPFDSITVVRGPQSTLYGGEAMGGVVAVQTQKGEGVPSSVVSVEGGSFGTIQGSVGAQGTSGSWAYNGWVEDGTADNQRPNNRFTATTFALRVDRAISPQFSVGLTWRGFVASYGSPGDRFTNNPYDHEREQNQLATVFAEYAITPAWSGRITVGGQDRRYASINPTPGQPTAITHVLNRRGVLDWQNTIRTGRQNRVTAGLTAERSQTRDDGFGAIDRGQSLLAFYGEDEWQPRENVFLTGGLRNDDHDTFGHATTGRVTAAWVVRPRRLKLRASYGTAFRAPGFLDLYGQSAYYAGNPNLKPEHSRGWDAGIDLYLPGSRATLSATWFENQFRDLIIYDFSVFPGTTANVEQARTRGVELSGRARWPGAGALRFAYTYLEADNLTEQTRLLRRPRHVLTAGVDRNLGASITVGAGVQYVAKRQDIDPVTFATIDTPDYAVARVYAAWVASRTVTVKVRIENVLDKRYEAVAGYPALGAGIFAGVESRF